MKVKIKRESGERVEVEVADRSHFEVTIEGNDDPQGGDDGLYWRYEYVAADNARQARKAMALRISLSEDSTSKGEFVEGVRAVKPDEVAVMKLRGAEVISVEAGL